MGNMRLIDKKTKKKLYFKLGVKFGWLLILLLGKLCSVKIIGKQRIDRLYKEKARIIYAIWHGRILLPIYIRKGEGITAMVSLHEDGEMIAQTLYRLGYHTVRGSSTRGGKNAFHEMVEVLKNGGTAAIMPDGPKGPRHKFKSGAIYLALQADAYIVPVTFSCKKKIEFKSWDRFNLITPFSKAIYIYGIPMKVPTDLTPAGIEDFKNKIEKIMIDYERWADEYFNK